MLQSVPTLLLFNKMTNSINWGLTFLPPPNIECLLRNILYCKTGKIMLGVLKAAEFWNLNSAAHSPGSINSRVPYTFSTILTLKSCARISDGQALLYFD